MKRAPRRYSFSISTGTGDVPVFGIDDVLRIVALIVAFAAPNDRVWIAGDQAFNLQVQLTQAKLRIVIEVVSLSLEPSDTMLTILSR